MWISTAEVGVLIIVEGHSQSHTHVYMSIAPYSLTLGLVTMSIRGEVPFALHKL